MMEFLKCNQTVLREALSSDPSYIVEKAEDILTKREDKMLSEILDTGNKIDKLIEMVIKKGQSDCEKFVEIMRKEQMCWVSCVCAANCSQAVYVDSGSNAVTPLISSSSVRSINMEVNLASPQKLGPRGQGGDRKRDEHPGSPSPGHCGDHAQPAVQSSVTVTGGSQVFSPIIHNSHINEDLNVFLNYSAAQVPGISTEQPSTATRRFTPFLPSLMVHSPSVGPPSAVQTPRRAIKDKQCFLTTNFSRLVQKVTAVDTIVDDLVTQGMNSETAANVRAGKTSHEKMRTLLVAAKKTKAMADALVIALLDEEPNVMEELLAAHHS
ncbi:hypothetical protein GN956_G13476 [Arapaima gigas]